MNEVLKTFKVKSIMNRTNKSIPKRKAKNEPDAILCDSCDRYYYSAWMQKRKYGNYCEPCDALSVRTKNIRDQVDDEEVEKLLRILLNAPPKKKRKRKK